MEIEIGQEFYDDDGQLDETVAFVDARTGETIVYERRGDDDD